MKITTTDGQASLNMPQDHDPARDAGKRSLSGTETPEHAGTMPDDKSWCEKQSAIRRAQDAADVLNCVFQTLYGNGDFGSTSPPMIGVVDIDCTDGLSFGIYGPGFVRPYDEKAGGTGFSLLNDTPEETAQSRSGSTLLDAGEGKKNTGSCTEKCCVSGSILTTVIKDMISDMESMRGMLCACSQLNAMKNAGTKNTGMDEHVSAMRLYNIRALAMIRRWRKFWSLEDRACPACTGAAAFR